MLKMKRFLYGIAILGMFTPLENAKADGDLNWYFYPFEYCANTCNTPLCCRTP